MPATRVVVVDDNLLNLELITFLLQDEGFEVEAVTDAEAALAAANLRRPEIFVIDVQLPGVSGLDLLRQLRSNPETTDVCAVIVTSYAMDADRERAHAAGCDHYFTKPIDTRHFASEVRKVYESRRRAHRQVSKGV